MSDSMVGRIKQWLKEFVEKAKALLGIKSDAAIIQALNSLIKSDGKFITGNNMLLEGAESYENNQGTRKPNYGASASGGNGQMASRGAYARAVSRAANRYSARYTAVQRGGAKTLHKGKSFGPYNDFVTYLLLDPGGHGSNNVEFAVSTVGS